MSTPSISSPAREAILNGLRLSLGSQAQSLHKLSESLGLEAAALVEDILALRGRVILSGMGKSGYAGKKAASTLSSTGTPALFLHPSESLHGDLGMVTRDDLVIFISKSGENPEIALMLPSLRRIGAPIAAITANPDSSLARCASRVLLLGPVQEICPLSLAPTTSVTLTLALLDSIAVELMKLRNFKAQDYALYHPGGQLGKRLIYQVGDLMESFERTPKVRPGTSPKEMLHEITAGRMGAVLVVDEGGALFGLITDNDVRRALEKRGDFFGLGLAEIMNPKPLCCAPEDNAFEVLLLMRQRQVPITLMPVRDGAGRLAGLIRLETMVQHGLV